MTYSHLSLLLCEVGGDVFEGGGCAGPGKEQIFQSQLHGRATDLALLADPHGLLVVRFEELEVLVDLDGLPAVLTHVKHCLEREQQRPRPH